MKQYVLWGYRADYESEWMKLSGGSMNECVKEKTYRKSSGGWKLVILPPGIHPLDEVTAFA